MTSPACAENRNESQTPRPSRRKSGALVVDNEPLVRNVLREILRYHHFNVWLAPNGEQAIELYRRNQAAIDVVLLDVTMPGMKGVTTFSALKALNPDLRICFMSTGGGKSVVTPLLQQGEALYFEKPFRWDELIEVLGQAETVPSPG